MTQWKRLQQLECLGVDFPSKESDLAIIQLQIEQLTNCLLNLNQEIDAFIMTSRQVNQNQPMFILTLDQQGLVSKLSTTVKQLFAEKNKKSFIIDQQPPQIIMTKTHPQNFANQPMRARFLLTRLLNGKVYQRDISYQLLIF